MLSRIGTIAVSQRMNRGANRIQALALASTTALAGAAAMQTYRHRCHSHYQFITSCDDSASATATVEGTPNPHRSPTSLIIPTLEAMMRAVRLVRTGVVTIVDYKLSAMAPSLSIPLMFSPLSESDKKYHETEEYVRRCQEDLSAAQQAYTSPNIDEDGNSNAQYNSMMLQERIESKKKQKLEMHQAAERLAAAEAELASLGDNSPKSRTHRRAAERLLKLCRENKGVYIKVGQHLANLDYLIPQEYIDVLSTLFDEAPESDIFEVRRVIEEDLGKDVEELFDRFDPRPIASASLAQVHVAYEKGTGRKLAVKVQHAGLRETSAGDLYAGTVAIHVIDRLFEEFTLSWLIDEMIPLLPQELDFTREGRNSEKAAVFMAQAGLNCVVPKVLWDKSTTRVLTMEFEEGFKSTDVESIEKAGLDKRDVSRLISSVFNSQIFESAWVHSDPHPANVLLRSNKGKPQMVLVDHGLYNPIESDFRVHYAKLWKALMMADVEGIREACKDIGVEHAYTLFTSVLTSRPFDEIIERSKSGSFDAPGSNPSSNADKAVIRGYAQHYIKEIVDLLGLLPRQMLLLLKMNDCLRHIDYALGTPTNSLVIAGKYASKAVYEHQRDRPGASFLSKFESWLGYMMVLFRIQIYEIGVRYMQRKAVAQ